MKKLGFLLFTAALSIGIMSAANCSFGNVNPDTLSGIDGSGIAKQETRNFSGFEKIEANGAFNAEISVGNAFSVTVETDDNLLQYIKTDVSDNTLKIFTEGKISPKTKINVKISMPELAGLDINGASTVTVFSVKGDSLKIKVNGASEVKIAGEIKDFDAKANGASTIDAENLKAESAVADSTGASTITISPVNKLKAEASGASTIYYTGDPENIERKSSDVSSIKKK